MSEVLKKTYPAATGIRRFVLRFQYNSWLCLSRYDCNLCCYEGDFRNGWWVVTFLRLCLRQLGRSGSPCQPLPMPKSEQLLTGDSQSVCIPACTRILLSNFGISGAIRPFRIPVQLALPMGPCFWHQLSCKLGGWVLT